ncbi:RNA-directed DNA polymerase, eukaryota [Tanacetum coccineum]
MELIYQIVCASVKRTIGFSMLRTSCRDHSNGQRRISTERGCGYFSGMILSTRTVNTSKSLLRTSSRTSKSSTAENFLHGPSHSPRSAQNLGNGRVLNFAGIGDKAREVEENMLQADAKLAEANIKSLELERKMQALESMRGLQLAKELFIWSLTFNDNKEVDDYSEDDSGLLNKVDKGRRQILVVDSILKFFPPRYLTPDERISNYVDAQGFRSEAIGNSGGILCVWDPSVFRKEHHVVSDNFVALYGLWVSNQAKLLVLSIYAPQSITSKRSLWSYISSLISRWDGHCMVMSDFNEVRCMKDRLGSVYNA